MDSFKNCKELKNTFVSGNFHFPEMFFIGDENITNEIEYRKNNVVDFGLEDMIEKHHKPMIVYSIRPSAENQEAAKAAGLNAWIVFLWGMDSKYRLLPYDVRSITRSRAMMTTRRSDEEVKEDYKEVNQDRIIPDKVRVMLLDLPVARELIGKVDTGADVCSLHAEDIDVNRGTQKVSFRCPPLSDNVLTVPLVDQQAIQTPSSDGTEYRPVISLNLKIADKALNDVRVNLNDRSNMEHPFLIGQNALETGNFLIDPNIIKEDLDDDAFIQMLTEEFSKDVVEEETLITQDEITQMYDLFEGSNVSLKDLIRILRTESMNRLNKLDY